MKEKANTTAAANQTGNQPKREDEYRNLLRTFVNFEKELYRLLSRDGFRTYIEDIFREPIYTISGNIEHVIGEVIGEEIRAELSDEHNEE
jgi:hypothetical protein